MNFDDYLKEPLPFINDLRNYYSQKDSLVIFEIGSCEGEDTIRLKKSFPNASIYTFEPLPANVIKIKSNLKKYGVSCERLFQLALSDQDGSADFYVSSGHPNDRPKEKTWDYGNKSSSLLPPKEHKKILKWIKFNEKIEVPTKRLDTFCAENGIDKIDIMYIDVQGAELLVLKGAGEMLETVGAVWMEVEAIELYRGQPLKSDVENFMKSHGFMKIIDTVDNVSGDQLYTNRSIRKSGPLQKLTRLLNSRRLYE